MRIGIDGYNLALPNGTGVATYGFMLASLLHDAGHHVDGVFGVDGGTDPALREVLFYEALGRAREPLSDTNRRRNARRATRKAWSPFLYPLAQDVPLTGRVETDAFTGRLPRFDRLVTWPQLFDIANRHFTRWGRFVRLRMTGPPDVMHWTYPVPVELIGSRNVYTLHDLVPLRLPYSTLDAKRRYRSLVAECIRRSAAVCTVSEASRRDIVAEFGISSDAVINTYQMSSLPGSFLGRSPKEDAGIIERTFGLRRHSYFLFFGAIEPKKNVGRLLEAYLSLETETPLVLVGGRAWQSDQEMALLDRLTAGNGADARAASRRVRKYDHLPRDLLLRLIRSARAVLFPSLYEGFGLPVLEAMQLGTPVLTSRTGALPEVAGEAALLVDPYSVDEIARGMARLDRDADLRARLSLAGPQQAMRFSQAAYLDRLETLYAQARESGVTPLSPSRA